MLQTLKAIRSALAFRRDPLAFLTRHHIAESIVRFRVGLSEFTLVNDPSMIRRVLVSESERYGEGKWTQRGRFVMRDCLITREGDPHRRRRALLNPVFKKIRLLDHLPAMTQRAEQLSVQWRDGDEIDVNREMGRLAIAIAGDAIFDADLSLEGPELLDSLKVMLAAIPRLPIPWPRLAIARRRVEQTASRLLTGGLGLHLREGGLSETAARDEIVALLIAVIDTTPGALAWTWFLLGRHEQTEAALHAELAVVLSGRAVTAPDLPHLTFMHAAFNEVLRLYPPVQFIDRRPLEDVELNGVRIRAGSWILLSPLITQRDPRYFDTPESFQPGRWQQNGKDGHKDVQLSFPFGAGPHGCIGEQLARLETAVALATLAQRWRLRPCPQLPANPSPQTSRLNMKLESRA